MANKPEIPDFPTFPDFGQMITQACKVVASVRGIPYDFNGALSLENKFVVLFKTVKEMFNAQNELVKSYKALYDFVNQYFTNLDLQTEVNKKIEEMKDSGKLLNLLQPTVTNEVTAWLTANITNPSNPPIDKSLTVENAAADAKATGNDINNLKENTIKILNGINSAYTVDLIKRGVYNGKYYDDSFRLKDNSSFYATPLINISIGDVLLYDNVVGSGGANQIIVFDENGMLTEYGLSHKTGTLSGVFVASINGCLGVSYTGKTPTLTLYRAKKKYEKEKNVTDEVKIEKGLNADGIEDANDNTLVSDYIDRENYDIIDLYGCAGDGNITNVAFYDSNKIFLKNRSINKITTSYYHESIVIPSECKYIRICLFKDSLFYNINVKNIVLIKSKTKDGIYKDGIMWACIGDSLTADFFDVYFSYIKKYTNLHGTNYGIGGRCVAQYSGADGQPSIVESICGLGVEAIPDSYKLVTILGGVNDCLKGLPIGNISDSVPTTFYGALNLICENLSKRNSDCKVVFITPYAIQFNNESIKNYADAIINICKKYHIEYIDMFSECGINRFNVDLYLRDGVHPNQRGADVIRSYLVSKFETIGITQMTPPMPH